MEHDFDFDAFRKQLHPNVKINPNISMNFRNLNKIFTFACYNMDTFDWKSKIFKDISINRGFQMNPIFIDRVYHVVYYAFRCNFRNVHQFSFIIRMQYENKFIYIESLLVLIDFDKDEFDDSAIISFASTEPSFMMNFVDKSVLNNIKKFLSDDGIELYDWESEFEELFGYRNVPYLPYPSKKIKPQSLVYLCYNFIRKNKWVLSKKKIPILIAKDLERFDIYDDFMEEKTDYYFFLQRIDCRMYGMLNRSRRKGLKNS